MDTIKFDKIVDALLYWGVIEDADDLDYIESIVIGDGKLTLHAYVIDEDDRKLMSLRDTIMMTELVYMIDRTPEVRPPDVETILLGEDSGE